MSVGYLADDFDWLIFATDTRYDLLDPIATAGTGTYFRPLITLSLQLEQAIGGEQALQVHKGANLAFHLISAVMVYGITFLICSRMDLAAGLSFLFLVHPAVVPSVFWISARVDSLMALFYLSAIFFFLAFLRKADPWLLILCATTFVAALLAKETGSTLVITLTVLALLAHRPQGVNGAFVAKTRRWVRPLLALFGGLTLIYLAFLWFTIYRQASDVLPQLGARELMEALLGPPVLLLAPGNETFLLQLYSSWPWLLGGAVAAFLLSVAVFLLILARSQGLSGLQFGLLLAALYLIPLLPLALSGANTRRMYLPLAVVCIMISFLPRVASPIGRWLPAVLLFLAPLLAAASLSSGSVWRHNWQLTQQYCESYRRIAREDNAVGAPALLLAAPGRARDAPLFANDVNAALHHCLTGEFGYLQRLLSIAEFRTARAAPGDPAFALQQRSARKFELTALSPADYFFFGSPVNLGRIYDDDYLAVDVTSLRGQNQVEAYSVLFKAGADLSQIRLLSFDSSGFQEVVASPTGGN